MWCVIAHNSDEEYWAYGMFEDYGDAKDFVEEMTKSNPEIEYTVAQYFHDQGNIIYGKQENDPAA